MLNPCEKTANADLKVFTVFDNRWMWMQSSSHP